jgi:tRNA pseudouridine55 synthase
MMDGVIVVNKPEGITSFDVVRKIKKLCNTKKVGHTGTLDPLAAGVLPVCIGRATKIVDFLMDGTKLYEAVLKLGIVTDTYDREGSIIETHEIPLSEEIVRSAILKFIGEIYQIPPMYSALKVNGQKLYELARQGIEIERKPRKINIYSINILKMKLPNVTFQVNCSKGTYIRSLCYDIGREIGSGGAMWKLLRLSTGGFNISEAVAFDELTEANINSHVISIDAALRNYKKVYFENSFSKFLYNGVLIKTSVLPYGIEANINYLVYLKNGDFIGIGSLSDKGFKINKLLNLE